MTLTLVTLTLLTLKPCVPEGVWLRELTQQVLPSSNPASGAGASPKLSKVIARAKALNNRQDPDQIAATLDQRMAVLEDFLTLCTGEEEQLVVVLTMLSLAITAGELGRWEPTRSRLVAAARKSSTTFPRCARAHLVLAAALQVVGRSALAPEARELAAAEQEAELGKCRRLEPTFKCALESGD